VKLLDILSSEFGVVKGSGERELIIRILGRFGTWHWAKAKSLQPEEALQRVRRCGMLTDLPDPTPGPT